MSRLEPTNEASAMQKEISAIAEQGGGTTKVEQLIQQYCPDGVEFRKLEYCLNYEQPTKYIVKDTKYDDTYPTPVLTAGQTFILGYTNEKTGIYQASKEKPVIIFDDFTTGFHWVDFDFKVKSSAMKMLRPTCDDISFRYVYYAMSSIHFEPGTHTRHWISIYSQFEIPVPPLPVQEEIVRILDNFTELQAELQAELQKRLQQYEYYRDKLLSFSDLSNWGQEVSVEWKKLGEIGKVCMCKRILKDQTSSTGDIPFFKIGTFGGSADAYISKELFEEYVKKYSYPKKGDILISAAGTIGRTVVFDGTPSYFQDSNIVWLKHDESVVLNSYLRYIYSLNPWAISTGGTIARLYNDNILNAVIPVPPLAEQQRIVDILDRFNALTTDITAGLPAEIEARRKQYEYYRDQLLTFKQK